MPHGAPSLFLAWVLQPQPIGPYTFTPAGSRFAPKAHILFLLIHCAIHGLSLSLCKFRQARLSWHYSLSFIQLNVFIQLELNEFESPNHNWNITHPCLPHIV